MRVQFQLYKKKLIYLMVEEVKNKRKRKTSRDLNDFVCVQNAYRYKNLKNKL